MVKHLVTFSLLAHIFPLVAHAQVRSAGVLDDALRTFRTAAEGWQNAIEGAATTLFWSLSVISLVWTMGQLALRRADLGEFFSEFIRFVLFTGFWDWMLRNGPHHASLIVDSMGRLAAQASGLEMPSPSGVLDVGFHLLDRALVQSSILSPMDGAIGIVLAIVILIVLALVGKDMLYTLAACWVVGFAGQFVLGFGGSRWTSDIAFNYYRKVLSLALHVLGLVLVVGVGAGFLRGYYGALQQDVSVHELAVLLVVSIVFVGTVRDVPPLLGGLANGSSFAAFGGGGGAGAALSTASGAVALAATASRPAAEVVGRLAKTAGAAAIGSGGAAITSLLDGFRSASSTDRASGSAGGAASGSVFPAPGSSGSASVEASSTAAPSSQPSHSVRRAGAGPGSVFATAPNAGQRSEPSARVADKAAPKASAASQRAAAADSPSSGHNDGRRGPFPRPDAPLAKADASRDRAYASMNPPPQGAKGAAEGAPGQGTRSPHNSSSKPAKDDASAWSAPAERADAGSRRPAADGATASGSSTMSPAGTFAHAKGAIPAVPGTTAAALAGSAALTSAPPSSTRPGSAIAAATRAAASSQEIPFSVAVRSDPVNATKAQPSADAGEPSDRAELPAAYSQQTSVDIEAEVSAFRDRD